MGMIRRTTIGFKDAHLIPDHNFKTADKLLTYCESNGFNVTLPIDVKEIAKLLDIEIYFVGRKDGTSGILQKLGTQWIMLVNKHHHPNRQRYTIAHEIGHYCLHRHQEYYFECELFFRNLDRMRTEKQANKFAMYLLMPEELVAQQINNGVVDVDKLAQSFGVATLALRIHAKENLGYVEKKKKEIGSNMNSTEWKIWPPTKDGIYWVSGVEGNHGSCQILQRETVYEDYSFDQIINKPSEYVTTYHGLGYEFNSKNDSRYRECVFCPATLPQPPSVEQINKMRESDCSKLLEQKEALLRQIDDLNNQIKAKQSLK